MKILGNIDLLNNLMKNMCLHQETDYPADSKAGMVRFISKRVMMCVEVDAGLPMWVPLTQELNTHVFDQEVAATTWTIPHGLNAAQPLIQCYDNAGNMMWATSYETVDPDTLAVHWAQPVSGRAILMAGSIVGIQRESVAYATEFVASDTVIVTHNLGYLPRTVVIVDGFEVQPQAIINDNNMQLTVVFGAPVTGEIQCY